MAALRVHLTHSNTVNHGWISSPAPAYDEHHVQRSKTSIPVRIIRRLTYRSPQSLDPDTIPVLTKREQRRLARQAQKQEQRQLDELVAYQRKKFHDEVSQQWENNQRACGDGVKQSRSTRVKNKVKNTIRRTRKLPAQNADVQSNQVVAPVQPVFHPIENIPSKSTSNTYFQPSDVEASPPQPEPSQELFLAELPAEPSPYLSHVSREINTKTNFDDSFEISPLSPPPAPIRSPSPCLSALPRRGITVSETPGGPSSRQMQCDYCHGAIRLTGYHYACNLCNDGDCLYCAKCANEGNTCRHELVERTRNIKRHPTNPSSVERRSLSVEDSFSDNGSHSVELSGASATPKPSHTAQTSNEPQSIPDSQTTPVSPINAENLFRDFEAKRREQEVAFREKEVTLREREAMLREREAWTASRERDAALVQQLHAAAMLQQRAEVGSQFAPASRRNSCFSTISRQPSAASQAAVTFDQRAPSLSKRSGSIVLHPHELGRKPNIELASSVTAMEASFEQMEINEGAIRSHGNSNKRKAASASSSKDRSATGRSASAVRPSNNSRTPSRNSNEDPEDNEEDEESDGASPKRLKSSASNTEPQKSFACPYSKFDPSRYHETNMGEIHYRSCSGGLYRDISRVKQHLKRIHHRPDFYCQRCFEKFGSSDKLQKHYSSPKSCDVKDCPWPERLDETKQGKIHVKRPGKDPKELWFEIFDIIFPGAQRPESPYIEQTQPSVAHPEILVQFIDLFNHKLDIASNSKPWLKSIANRAFLQEQLNQVLQDMRVQSSNVSSVGVTSVLVSPISPPPDFQSRSDSQCSAISSTRICQASLSPELVAKTSRSSIDQNRPPRRPALKLDSSYGGDSSEFAYSHSSINSARSYRNPFFPQVPRHVAEDHGYGLGGESWASGDDVHHMGDTQIHIPEPSSATSTRSEKSVKFITPEQEMLTYSEPKVPTLMDFARTYSHSHSHTFALDLDVDPTYHQRVLSDFEKKRPDSAYGTLSSRHPSSSSLASPYSSSPPTAIFHGKPVRSGSTAPASTQWQPCPEELMCVDPQVLLRGPVVSDHPDVQAYLNRNRNMDGHFGIM